MWKVGLAENRLRAHFIERRFRPFESEEARLRASLRPPPKLHVPIGGPKHHDCRKGEHAPRG